MGNKKSVLMYGDGMTSEHFKSLDSNIKHHIKAKEKENKSKNNTQTNMDIDINKILVDNNKSIDRLVCIVHKVSSKKYKVYVDKIFQHIMTFKIVDNIGTIFDNNKKKVASVKYSKNDNCYTLTNVKGEIIGKFIMERYNDKPGYATVTYDVSRPDDKTKKFLELETMRSTWDAKKESHVLDLGKRVKHKSNKNFAVVDKHSSRYVNCGKIEDNFFVLELNGLISPLHAFGMFLVYSNIVEST